MRGLTNIKPEFKAHGPCSRQVGTWRETRLIPFASSFSFSVRGQRSELCRETLYAYMCVTLAVNMRPAWWEEEEKRFWNSLEAVC